MSTWEPVSHRRPRRRGRERMTVPSGRSEISSSDRPEAQARLGRAMFASPASGRRRVGTSTVSWPVLTKTVIVSPSLDLAPRLAARCG